MKNQQWIRLYYGDGVIIEKVFPSWLEAQNYAIQNSKVNKYVMIAAPTEENDDDT